MAARKRPLRITIRSYQVGFGDCWLLGFHYASGMSRFVLVDFGTTGRPKGAPSALEVAEDIRTVTGGQLTAIVATHRHEDHISGFSGKSGNVIRSLVPKLVLQPWTEHPDAAPNALRPPTTSTAGPQAFVAALEHMHAFAAAASVEARRGHGAVGVRRQLEFLGQANIKNRRSVEMLMNLPCRHVYASYGSTSGLDALLPGVRTRVLGPPTLAQTETIRSQTDVHPEFWSLLAAAAQHAATGRRLFPRAPRASAKALPFETRWFLPRLEAIRAEQLLQVVRALDDAMNNTSLILLLKVGSLRLLFPGDAQVENWLYALHGAPESERNRRELEKVRVYKVGHHGSLNATPRSLWNRFEHLGAPGTARRLVTLLSTLGGKHGSTDRDTEVPRRTLVEQLQTRSDLHTTQDLPKGQIAAEITIPVP